MAAQARSKKPEDSDFKQQRLRAWEPLLTPFWVILTFLSVGLLFLIIGIVTLHASNQTVEVEQEYKGTNPICPFDPDAPQPPDCCDISLPNDPNCLVEVELVIPKTMTPPIFVYYKLTSFYQNHRRYVKSRSDPQLSGTRRPDVSPCDPLESIGDKTLYPCGLIAHSRYNDTVLPPRVERDGSEVELDWEDKGIAWKSDMKHKFEARPLEDHETNIGPNGPVTIDEELAVWMRTAGLPTFKKLHRIIRRESLLEGETVTVPVHDGELVGM